MQRHNKQDMGRARSGPDAALLRVLATMALILTSTGTMLWTAPGASAVVQPIFNTFNHQQLEQLELRQQDAEDATAGATGASGTVNGVPRETAETAPVVTTGPGAPLAPGEVLLPPAVPGLPAAGVDPTLAGGIGGTAELAFGAVSDTTVFSSAPNAPQSPESAGLLAIGGPQGAVTLISFDVAGVGEGVVLSALLTFTGAGAAGGLGGSVGVIYDYVVPDGLTANGVPDGGSALNVHGVPSWFEAVEPGGLTAIDVTGSVYGDGVITFVLPGQSESIASFHALESGIPPELILTVALPA